MAFICSICDKAVGSKLKLRVHMRIHTGERPFKCQQCTKAFIHSTNLKRHEHTHTGERPFKCHKCTKAFTDSSHLKRHERTHTGERPFKCQQCPKAFTQSNNLKVHERTHRGEKPFKCQQCTKAFIHSSHLKSHERIHKGERQFEYPQCANAFTLAYHLKRHERTHTSKNNSTSSNENEIKSPFKYSQQEKLHERTHIGERPFKCDNCNKTFTRAHNLKRHERIHTSENNRTFSNNNERKCPFKNSRLEEFPQPDILTRNLSTIEGENGYSYQVYQKKFPMNNEMTYHRKIHSEVEANHSIQSSSNIQSLTSIHPEQHLFQDGITNQSFPNYQIVSTRFNAMDKANFPHQFISQNIQSTVSPLVINIQTQGGKNISTLNAYAENGQNLHNENSRLIFDNTDVNSQIQNVSLLENTYDQRFTGSSTQNEKRFSFLQMLLGD